MNAAPAAPGDRLVDVDTPALLVDLDAFERNLARMADVARRAGVRLRPHAKTHKCPDIALRQIALGAVGVCCQKVSEAEAMVAGGVRDVLVSNEIVGARKIERLVAMARTARVGVCVDDEDNARNISAAAVKAGVTIDVLVEINVGGNRCGVESGEPAAGLARVIAGLPGLHFLGLQAYHGSAQHIRTLEARRAAIASATEKAARTRDFIVRTGGTCERITGAGTGTHALEAATGVYDELQAGSYIFLDADYARNLDGDGKPIANYEHSLFLYATVMSRTAPSRAVVDAGLKAVAVDSGLPTVVGVPGAEYVSASDEHGKLSVPDDCRLRPGDKVRLIPGHCDPTCNLHDWFVGYRGDRVECLWPITGRGPGF